MARTTFGTGAGFRGSAKLNEVCRPRALFLGGLNPARNRSSSWRSSVPPMGASCSRARCSDAICKALSPSGGMPPAARLDRHSGLLEHGQLAVDRAGLDAQGDAQLIDG